MVDMRDMADVLRGAGVPVVEEGDWKHRGTGGSFNAEGLMLHHDASPPGSSSGSADYIIDNLLSQLWLSYSGTWHVIAAGRMNHAGKGSWPGVPTDNANATFIGIETDHTTNESWTSGQQQSGLRGLVALADWLGIRDSADDLYRHLIGHKEWAPDRKVDPDPLDMNDLRAFVLQQNYSEGGAPVKTVQRSCVTPRTLKKDQWIDLQFADEGEVNGSLFILANGFASWYVSTVQAYISGPPGTEFQLRPYRQVSGGGDEFLYSVRDFVIPKDGNVGVELSFQGSLASDWYLRVMGRSMGANLTVDKAWGETALW